MIPMSISSENFKLRSLSSQLGEGAWRWIRNTNLDLKEILKIKLNLNPPQKIEIPDILTSLLEMRISFAVRPKNDISQHLFASDKNIKYGSEQVAIRDIGTDTRILIVHGRYFSPAE